MARFRPPPGPLSKAPTAQTLPAEVDVTPVSWLESPGLGLDALTHFRPFQCMIRVVLADPARRSPAGQGRSRGGAGTRHTLPGPAVPAQGDGLLSAPVAVVADSPRVG